MKYRVLFSHLGHHYFFLLRMFLFLSDFGHYVYVEAQWEDVPATATLYHSGRKVSCLQFWYYMYGELTPSLTVTTQIGGTVNEPVFLRSGSQGDLWHPAKLDLVVIQEYCNVSVEKNLSSLKLWDGCFKKQILMCAIILCCKLYAVFLSVVHFMIWS